MMMRSMVCHDIVVDGGYVISLLYIFLNTVPVFGQRR